MTIHNATSLCGASVLFKSLSAILNHFVPFARRFPSHGLHALAFKALIDSKEVLDFFQNVRIDSLIILYFGISRVARGDRQDSRILLALVHHAQHADGADFHDASGEAGGIY